ncbi:MAG TPA: DMT family transporter [Methylomirabilota bacterium]|nr:DMT family transporter [Methylomirabilota bacterium]
MPTAYVVLLVSNLIFATGYSISRIVLEDISPVTLAMVRLAIGSLILVPWAWSGMRTAKLSREDHWRLGLTGVVGFTLAFALGNWGLAHSTASNAALLITVEPASLILLSPLLLGERLSRRESLGAALAILGAAVIVVNGIPGVTLALAPHWRGDLVLILSGVAYAAYSLIARPVLLRQPALVVTAYSIVWGAVAMLPFALLEWATGSTPGWTPRALMGALYLGVVMTALGYAVWNWCLERVETPRVAIFLNIQPLGGALLGVWWLGERLTVFTVAGGLLILAGLHLTVKARRRG